MIICSVGTDVFKKNPRQKVVSEVMSSVERSRIGSEKNFPDVLDKVREVSNETVGTTHVFTLISPERLRTKGCQ